jgi:S1-C subfamily serine protease
LLLLLLLARAAVAQDKTPIHVDTAKSASISFTRLVIQDNNALVVGVAADSYRILILDALRSSGYDVRGAESVVFDQDRSDEARFFLGGTLTKVTVWAHGFQRDVEVAVRWELLDSTLDRVVYRVETRGFTTNPNTVPNDQVATLLVRSALSSLLSRQNFVDHVLVGATTQTVEAPPPTWSEPLAIRACDAQPAALPAGLPIASDATVIVRSGERLLGSGVLVSRDGFVYTAAHVVTGIDALEVSTHGGMTLPAKTIRVDPFRDVAVLSLQGSGFPCLALATEMPALGSDIYAIGVPLAAELQFSVSRGVVSGVRNFAGAEFIQTDASINHGNSGGPLLDVQGRVAAIVDWKVEGGGTEGIGFGIPVSVVATRLGIRWDTASEKDPARLAGTLGPTPAAAVVDDTADAPRMHTSSGSSTTLSGEHGASKPLVVGGAVTAGVGAVMILTTWAVYGGADTMTSGEWGAVVGVNTTGWVLFLTGGTLAVVGAAGGGGGSLAIAPVIHSDGAGVAMNGRF